MIWNPELVDSKLMMFLLLYSTNFYQYSVYTNVIFSELYSWSSASHYLILLSILKQFLAFVR